MRVTVIVGIVVAWGAVAQAGVTMTNDPVDVGGVNVGSQGSATGSLDDTNNHHVDLQVTSTCSGAGAGTFTVSPNNNVNLNSAQTITVKYTANAIGSLRCTVNVLNTGTTTKLGSFDVTATGHAPNISIPASQAFGSVRFNNAAPAHTSLQNITVMNNGDRNLDITNVTFSGTNPGDFSIALGGTTATILPSNTATWQILFDPGAAGNRSATLTFTSNDPDSPTKSMSLTGTGTTAIIKVNDLSYGIVNTGSSSSLDVNVQNNGASPSGNLGVTSASITGGNGWFTFSGCGGGLNCTFSPALSIASQQPVGVVCSPPANANANDMQMATVAFTSDTDDATATPDNVSTVTCTAGKSVLVTSASNVGFTSQLVTTTSSAQGLTVNNPGNVNTSIYFRLTGTNASNFTVSTISGCGAQANPCLVAANGGSVAFNVTFSPTVEGDVSAGLDLVSSTAPFPQLALSGHGVDRHIMIAMSAMAPTTFRNPGDMEAPFPVTIHNTGEYMLHVSSLSVASDPIWTLADPNVAFDVPGLGSHDVMVKFAPMEAGKAPDGVLMITSDDRTFPNTMIGLVGNGKDRNVDMYPGSIDIGNAAAGVPTKLSIAKPDQVLTVANMDPDNVFHIREVKIEGDQVFQVQQMNGDDVASTSLEASSSTQLEVVFQPPKLGEYSALITLYLDQDPVQQKQVEIHGRALFVDAHGSGGCAVGGGAGAGLVFVVALLALRRRRGAVLALLIVPAIGRADVTRNVDLSVFDPTPTTSGSALQLQTADVGAPGDYVATAFASYATGQLVLSSDTTRQELVRRRTMMSIGGAYAFGHRFEVGARMPLYMQSGQKLAMDATGDTPVEGTSRGNLTLHAKVRALVSGPLRLGVGLGLELPTATDGQFAGAASPVARLLALASYSASPRLTFHVNAGAVIRKSAQYTNFEERNGGIGGVGATFRVADPLWVSAEMFGDMIPSGYTPKMGDTLGAASTLWTVEWIAGARLDVTPQLSVGLGGGRGLTSGVGSPGVRGVLTIAYAPEATALPSLRPPPEVVVAKPAHPGDMDVDRIPDAVDKCPNEPEDIDGFQDEDGCPELDNDNDGIPDTKDKCPMVAEDKDGFEDSDGCPDPDNDKDGIPDAQDKCPDKPEVINGIEDEDGCPDRGDSLIVSSPERLDLLEPIEFTGMDVSKKSEGLLGQVAATLKARADIARMRIAVHVQPTARADRDQDATDKRSLAVKTWLVKHGVASDRLEAKGYGGTKPLVSPRDKSAAFTNNRVELIILDRK